MGWRTDHAYEDAQRAEHAAFKASLTWPEYMAWQWSQWRAFVAGAGVGAVVVGLIWMASR